MAYEVNYSYLKREYGSSVFDADDADQAENFAYDHVRDTYPDASDIQVEDVTEVKPL